MSHSHLSLIVCLLLGLCGCNRDQSPKAVEPSGPRIRQAVVEPQASLSACGIQITSFRFDDGLVEASIEEERGENSRKLAQVSGEAILNLRRENQQEVPDPIHGEITWLRRQGKDGKQQWDLAIALLNSEGKNLGASAKRDIIPAFDESDTWSEGSNVPKSGWLSLEPDKEVILYTISYSTEDGTRTLFHFKCKLVEMLGEK